MMPPSHSKVKTRSSQPINGKDTIPAGFISGQRARKPIDELGERELRDLYSQNEQVLSVAGASTSAYVERIQSEQAAVESRLVEIVGMENINMRLKHIDIKGEEDMDIVLPEEPPLSRAIGAKQRALARFNNTSGRTQTMNFDEAVRIEQARHAADQEHRERILEKKRQQARPLTQAERDARIWAFLNHKPTESDEEDEEDEGDPDDEDPATWFEDDQDDGRKGQDIVLPDEEDYSDIIRVDTNPVHRYNTFYEPPDN